MIRNLRTARIRRRCAAVLTSIVMLASSQAGQAESQQDFLVFLSAEAFERLSASDPTLEYFENRVTADFLYTYNSDRFRFLGEYVWTDAESELERIQAGWEFDEHTILWLGRFHSISNYWTTEYHHGQFMQTSISRPGVEAWEDESGPMPSHITGLWVEHEFNIAKQSALNLGITAGLAPKFEGDNLIPYDILDSSSGHDMAISSRLVYRPHVLSMDQIGITISRNNIDVVSDSGPNLADLNSIRQVTVGIFSNWQWKNWRLATNAVYFNIDMKYGSGDLSDIFFLGYAQIEYEAAEGWTIFGRTEFGEKEDDSIYLQLLPSVIAHRQMLGVRWDIADSHALTFEVADTSRQGDDFMHDSFKELRFQWSAVFP